MRKNKSNISLINLSEVKQTGLLIAARKGLNELVNRRKSISSKSPNRNYRVYKDMVSVIVCTANRGCLAEKAVESLQNQNFDGNFEIIVVNNSETPLNCKIADNIKIINQPIPGLSLSRNRGAESAQGEYIIYIDDDSIADKNLVSSIYNSFISEKNYAIIGGQIFLKTPNPLPEIFLEGKEALWSAYTVPYKKFHEVKEQYEFPYGACFGIRHSFLDRAGGFPESYGRCGNDFAGGEETALCFMARKLKLKIGINPEASVLHCVLPERFNEEHVKKTIRESIITTYRLYKDGYSPTGWTLPYINERIKIIEYELRKLSGKELYYKQCEYNAFKELKDIMSEELI